MTRFAIVRPANPTEAEIIEEDNLDEWAYKELSSLGPIDNPDFDPSWSMTNLIGMGYIVAEIREVK